MLVGVGIRGASTYHGAHALQGEGHLGLRPALQALCAFVAQDIFGGGKVALCSLHSKLGVRSRAGIEVLCLAFWV